MRRIIALDIGTVRIGVAVSDPLGTFAQGLDVLRAGGAWMDDLSQLLDRYDARTLLVGMPRRTDGSDGPEADRMRKVIERLAARFPAVEIVEWDERFTTTIATQALLEADVSRKNRKGQVDKIAATILLQNYLDAIRDAGPQSGADIPLPDSAPAGRDAAPRKRRKNAYD